MFHMFRESDLERLCPMCKTEHKGNGGWKPEFWKDFHYKTCTCPDCGHKIFFKTKEFNSGHY